ncbi:tripartite tricarboxylate transporter TctB family protein [Alloalcanivorax mobilis]|uniref:tripartite tricarboxylate transporter TctB family protein n=1 Tax=Alloalcanivorax mobilis TaxID=2019569 RepID=UPI000B5B1F5E|nr:tripartite tricarboxylate transporter TctB family protein [Alloalcanivorax mobilis]ASK36122.1 hypothetical protein CEK62_17900 [Alcanivorax sp. N3-2A]|tara:strand:- start:10482 stop:10961 length:480 start_codon:yes stop_codon:yes gene_type:complete
MKARALDVCYGGAALLAILAVYVGGGSAAGSPPLASNPYWYPKVLLILIGVCAVWLIMRAALGRSGAAPASVQWRALAGSVVVSGAFLFGYERIGFVPCTVVLVVVMGWMLGFRRPLMLLVVSVLFTAAVWYGFSDLLNRTPPGPALPSPASLLGASPE